MYTLKFLGVQFVDPMDYEIWKLNLTVECSGGWLLWAWEWITCDLCRKGSRRNLGIHSPYLSTTLCIISVWSRQREWRPMCAQRTQKDSLLKTHSLTFDQIKIHSATQGTDLKWQISLGGRVEDKYIKAFTLCLELHWWSFLKFYLNLHTRKMYLQR